jgi:hypothetical protein
MKKGQGHPSAVLAPRRPSRFGTSPVRYAQQSYRPGLPKKKVADQFSLLDVVKKAVRSLNVHCLLSYLEIEKSASCRVGAAISVGILKRRSNHHHAPNRAGKSPNDHTKPRIVQFA